MEAESEQALHLRVCDAYPHAWVVGKPYHGDFGLFFKKQQFKLFRNIKQYSYLGLILLDHLSMTPPK